LQKVVALTPTTQPQYLLGQNLERMGKTTEASKMLSAIIGSALTAFQCSMPQLFFHALKVLPQKYCAFVFWG